MRNERESNIMKAPCKTVSVLLVNALDLTKAGHIATFQFQRLRFGSGVILSEKNFKLTAELKSFWKPPVIPLLVGARGGTERVGLVGCSCLDSSSEIVIISNRSVPLPQTSGLLFLGETSAPPFYLKNLGVKLSHGFLSQTLKDFRSHSLCPSSPVRLKLKEKVRSCWLSFAHWVSLFWPGSTASALSRGWSYHCDQLICHP